MAYFTNYNWNSGTFLVTDLPELTSYLPNAQAQNLFKRESLKSADLFTELNSTETFTAASTSTLKEIVHEDNVQLAELSPKKGSRKQPGVACVACRQRRIRCEKNIGGPCDGCKARSSECVFPTKGKRKISRQNRSGKRIEEAKVIYGKKKDFDDTSPIIQHSPLLANQSEAFHSHQSSLFLVPTSSNFLSHLSTDAKLRTMELTSALNSHLIECFFSNTDYTVPYVDWGSFRLTFDLAGRRLNQLDSEEEVIGSFILALGARATLDPNILGPNYYDAQKRLASKGIDLSAFGKTRALICDQLEKRAIELADSHMLTLTTSDSPSSFGIMMLAQEVESYRGKMIRNDRYYQPTQDQPRYRQSSLIFLRHLIKRHFQLNSRDLPVPLWIPQLTYSSSLFDAINSLRTHNLFYTFDDLVTFFGEAHAREIESNPDPAKIFDLLDYQIGLPMILAGWRILLNIGRFSWRTLVSRDSRDSRDSQKYLLDLKNLRLIWTSIDLLLEWIISLDPELHSLLQPFLRSRFPTCDPEVVAQDRFARPNARRMFLTTMIVLIQVNMESTIRSKEPITLSRILQDEEISREVQEMEFMSKRRRLRDVRLMKAWWQNELGSSQTLGVRMSVQLLYYYLPHLVETLILTPIDPEHLSFDEKLSTLILYRDVLFNIGFSWPAFSSLVERISVEICNLAIPQLRRANSTLTPENKTSTTDPGISTEFDFSMPVDGEIDWSEKNGCIVM